MIKRFRSMYYQNLEVILPFSRNRFQGWYRKPVFNLHSRHLEELLRFRKFHIRKRAARQARQSEVGKERSLARELGTLQAMTAIYMSFY